MGDPPDFIISPRIGGVGLFEFHRAGELVEMGQTAAQRQINDILENGAACRANGRAEAQPIRI
jgi:NTE family protein